MDICNACKKELTYAGISLGDQNGYELLCNDCFNKKIAEKRGIEKPFSDYLPITLEDSYGIPHTFRIEALLLSELAIEAVEIENNKPKECGYQFKIMVEPDIDPMEAFKILLKKIKNGLNQKFLTLNKNDFSPEINSNDIIIGRIEESYNCDNYQDELSFSIDGKKLTLIELEKLLSPYIGFNFKLSIYDPCDDIP